MHFARSVQTAILAGLLIASAATAAPVTFGSYYDENATPPAICSTSLCTVFFSQLPSDRLLLVTNELSPKVGDGGKRKGGIAWGCLTPPLLHRRSDMPCPTITSSI